MENWEVFVLLSGSQQVLGFVVFLGVLGCMTFMIYSSFLECEVIVSGRSALLLV